MDKDEQGGHTRGVGVGGGTKRAFKPSSAGHGPAKKRERREG